MRAEHITIAITVYDRRDFLNNAIQSALDQTVPVRVVVVEDCGPDASLRSFITSRFGNRVQYIRNPKNRGLFDNWNVCIECCQTPWLSILHDDDLLLPNFVEDMLKLAAAKPDHAFYHGQADILDQQRDRLPGPRSGMKCDFEDIDLVAMADQHFIMMFAGNLFSVAAAKAVSGVRRNSYYTGDWDFWFRLALHGGAAQTSAVVALARSHEGPERGTTRVDRKGWKWALENVQRKHNLALLKEAKGISIPFNRTKHLEKNPLPARQLLRDARGYSRRMLAYNAWLFTHSTPPHWRYALLQKLCALASNAAKLTRYCASILPLNTA